MALKAYWKFDEKVGTAFADSSGNNHPTIDGNINGFTHGRVWTTGVEGSFRPNYHLVASHSDFTSVTHSMEAWIKVAAAPLEGGYGIIIGRWATTGDNGGWAFGIDENRRLIACHRNGDFHLDDISVGSAQLALDRWYHVAITAEVGGLTVYFYINGALDVSREPTTLWTENGSTNIGIGANYDGAGTFQGQIDDLKYYDSILSDVTIAADYAAGRDSGPAIYTLRASGGDFTTYDTMAAMAQSLFPLVEDVTVYCQGGQAFGAGGNARLSLPSAVGNNHSITIMTDPLEVSTPVKIIGPIVIDSDTSNITLIGKKMKLQDTDARPVIGFGTNGVSGQVLQVEDCLIASRTSSGFLFRCGSGFVKNSTFLLSGNAQFDTSALVFYNCILLYNSALAINTETKSDHCTFYNFGAGVLTVTGTNTDALVGNPNLAGGIMITAEGELESTMIARDAHLTALSALCIGLADAATATTTDIVGVTRA